MENILKCHHFTLLTRDASHLVIKSSAPDYTDSQMLC